ncbi:chitinase B, partial [Vibrio parahaemolyticus AQ3810]
MIRFNLCAAGVALALSGAAVAAPTAPSVDMYGSNNLQFSKIELAMETTSGYYDMVKYHDQAKITVKFNQWSGTPGDTYNIYFDGVKVATGAITGGQTTATFDFDHRRHINFQLFCKHTGTSAPVLQVTPVSITGDF